VFDSSAEEMATALAARDQAVHWPLGDCGINPQFEN
jgi:hypothetical protein